MTKLNGTSKTIAVITGIVLAAGGVIWALAIQSGNLDDVIEDVDSHEIKYDKVEVRVNTVEKAVIKIETQMGYVQKSQEDMMVLQGKILDELRK